MSEVILGIESSCDDTAAAIIKDGVLLSNVVARQDVHKDYGGVVPELASRAHQQHIVPVVEAALKRAQVTKEELNAIAFTRGPGLLGSLIVGTSFTKGLSMSLGIPMIEINHLEAHVLAHFIKTPDETPKMPRFPFLCLLVSGGNTQIILVKDFLDMEVIGETIDDAAGEAFDKCAKIMNLPYPGGILIDQHASKGDPKRFTFNKPNIPELNYSFSGLKTSFLYTLRKEVQKQPNFVEQNLFDICSSLQATIVDILMHKLKKAVAQTSITEVAIAGGVSANTGLRKAVLDMQNLAGWKVFVPKLAYSTDNAAMIAMNGYYKMRQQLFTNQAIGASAVLRFKTQ